MKYRVHVDKMVRFVTTVEVEADSVEEAEVKVWRQRYELTFEDDSDEIHIRDGETEELG